MKMRFLKSKSAQTETAGRRSFLRKLGAGASTVLGSSVAVAKKSTENTAGLEHRVAVLEAEKALRKLHEEFEQAVDSKQMATVTSLFADGAEVRYKGESFSGRKAVGELFVQRFAETGTGKRVVPGQHANHHGRTLEVDSDLLSARATIPYQIQIGRYLETENSLATLAHSQGSDVITWQESGEYIVKYSRSDRSGGWQIERLEYSSQSQPN